MPGRAMAGRGRQWEPASSSWTTVHGGFTLSQRKSPQTATLYVSQMQLATVWRRFIVEALLLVSARGAVVTLLKFPELLFPTSSDRALERDCDATVSFLSGVDSVEHGALNFTSGPSTIGSQRVRFGLPLSFADVVFLPCS